MKTGSKFERWMAVLTGPCIAVSGAQLLAGVVLAGVFQLPIDGMNSGSGHLLLGLFLLYSGVVLATSTIVPKKVTSGSGNLLASLFLGELALMIVGFIQAGLAVEALFSSPARPEYAPLLISASLSLALMNALDIFDKEEKQAEIDKASAGYGEAEEETEDDAGDEDLDEPRQSAWATLIAFSMVALYYVLYSVPVLGWIVFSFWIYARVRRESFEGIQFEGTAEWLSLLSALKSTAPTLVGTLVAIFVVTVGIGLVIAIVQMALRILSPQSRRPLNAAEQRYIEKSEKEVRAYVSQHGFKRNYTLAFIFIAFMIALPSSAVFAMVWLSKHIPLIGLPTPLVGEDLKILVQPEYWSTLVLFFSLLLLSAIIAYVFNWFFPRTVEASTGADLVRNDAPISLASWITIMVRYGRLNTDRPINPREFLLHSSTIWVPFLVYPGLVLLLLSVVMFQLDRGNFDLITNQRVVTVDYWTQVQHETPLAKVKSVLLKCTFDKRTPEPAYILELPDGSRVYAAEKFEVETRLEDLENIDQVLATAQVPVDFIVISPWFDTPYYGYLENCIEEYASRMDEDKAARFKRLMRLEEFQKIP